MTVENNPTLDLLRGGVLYLDNNGKVAGGGYYRVEIIAQLFGVSVRRIQQLTQEGVLPTTETPEGRRYDLVPTIQSYVQYLSDKAYGKNRSEKETELREQKMKAEIALKESQGELHRLKTEIAAGKYISLEEVTLDYTRFFVTFKRFAMSLPSRITGIIGNYVEPLEARHIEKDLTGEIQKLLEAFVVAAVTEQVNGTKTKK
jgi:phage terminase Nu1 subunit (DNA packaging protein)